MGSGRPSIAGLNAVGALAVLGPGCGGDERVETVTETETADLPLCSEGPTPCRQPDGTVVGP